MDKNDSKIYEGSPNGGPSLLDEPMFALASAQVKSAVAIIRLSGIGSHDLLERCLSRIVAPSSRKMRQLYLGDFCDPVTRDLIDRPLVVWFKSPFSFTGQDSAEVHLHGGPYVVRQAISALRNAGFRDADPGEFTRRAYLNGKFDLSEAEGIREIIDAETEQQFLAARQMSEGKLSKKITELRGHILKAMAYLEAQIDFPDEGETKDLTIGPAGEALADAQRSIAELTASYQSGRIAKEGLRVAIIGRPNAGKSTLMNQLLGHDRAIVTSTAGTTRDYIEENCLIEGRMFRLIDTAGIRETTDEIERQGIRLSKEQASTADLIILLQSCDEPATPDQAKDELLTGIDLKKLLRVATKTDLGTTNTKSIFDAKISAVTESGINELKTLLVSRIDNMVGDLESSLVVTNERHIYLLKSAKLSLDNFFDHLKSGEFAEILAAELAAAANALSEIIGKIDTDDILDRVFSQFCIGK